MSEHRRQSLEERLESLARSIDVSPAVRVRVLEQVEKEPAGRLARRLYIRRWIMRGTIGMAACLVVGAFVWTLLVSEPQRAYGIGDVRKQISGSSSFYVAGTAQDGQPFEIFVERPNRSSRRQGTFRFLVTPDGQTVIDEEHKRVVRSPVSGTDAEYMVESVLQTQLIDQLLGPKKEALKKVRTEEVNGVNADVYESVVTQGPMRSRSEVALNPKTGLPIRCVTYILVKGEAEVPLMTIDKIVANEPAPKGTFEWPADWDVQTSTERGDAFLIQTAATTGLQMMQRYAFDLGQKGILLCWGMYETTAPAADLKLGLPAFHVGDGAYSYRVLHHDATPEGYHWRWSVLAPTGAAAAPAEAPLVMELRVKQAHLLHSVQPIKLERERLGRMVVEAQRQTMGEGGKPMTLEEIEQKLGEGD